MSCTVLGAVCCFPFAYAGVLLIAAFVLRATVSLANRFMGASGTTKRRHRDYEHDPWLGYRAYQGPPKVKGIANPGIGVSLICPFLINVVSGLLAVPVWGFEDRFLDVDARSGFETLVLAEAGSLLIGFPLYAWIIASLLTCTFKQGCLVLLLNYIFVVVLAYILIVIASVL